MEDELDKVLQKENPEEPEVKSEGTPGVGKEKKEDTKVTSADVDAYKKAIAEQEIERIRQEEKAKLYASFEKYKNDAKAAEDARKEAEAKLKEYETSKLSAEEQAVLKLQQLEEANNKLTVQMQDLVEAANSRIGTLELELTKKELLAKYGEEIIPSMVAGNTLEEIVESAENAHREYMNIFNKAEAKAKETAVDKTKLQVGTGIKPQNDKLNTGTTVADIRKINDKEQWEKNRDRLLEEALKS
jgi:hypothetical protein